MSASVFTVPPGSGFRLWKRGHKQMETRGNSLEILGNQAVAQLKRKDSPGAPALPGAGGGGEWSNILVTGAPFIQFGIQL